MSGRYRDMVPVSFRPLERDTSLGDICFNLHYRVELEAAASIQF